MTTFNFPLGTQPALVIVPSNVPLGPDNVSSIVVYDYQLYLKVKDLLLLEEGQKAGYAAAVNHLNAPTNLISEEAAEQLRHAINDPIPAPKKLFDLSDRLKGNLN